MPTANDHFAQSDENFFLIYDGRKNLLRKHAQVMEWPSMVDFKGLSTNPLQWGLLPTENALQNYVKMNWHFKFT